jgi:Ribosomal subunit 39S
MQLTGIRILDSAISSSHTARSLLMHITQKPKPAAVFDALAQRSDLVNLPNVKIFNRRITPIDREKMVGRWKIIEKELNRRELPVTGH